MKRMWFKAALCGCSLFHLFHKTKLVSMVTIAFIQFSFAQRMQMIKLHLVSVSAYSCVVFMLIWTVLMWKVNKIEYELNTNAEYGLMRKVNKKWNKMKEFRIDDSAYFNSRTDGWFWFVIEFSLVCCCVVDFFCFDCVHWIGWLCISHGMDNWYRLLCDCAVVYY